MECLTRAQVVCSTLTGAGSFQMGPYTFGLVVIDEAAQVSIYCLLAARVSKPYLFKPSFGANKTASHRSGA